MVETSRMTTTKTIKSDFSTKKKIIYKDSPSITLLAAVSLNGYIGFNKSIPWRLKSDLKRFKEYTLGKPLLMGINTFESLPTILSGRLSIVLTKDITKVQTIVDKFKAKYPDKEVPDVIHFSSISEFQHGFDSLKTMFKDKYDFKELIIGGGSSIYESFIDYADKVLLTLVSVNCLGDAVFPKCNFKDTKRWKVLKQEAFFKNEDNEYDYRFFIFERPLQAKVISFSGRCEITKLDRAATDEVVNKSYTDLKE